MCSFMGKTERKRERGTKTETLSGVRWAALSVESSQELSKRKHYEKPLRIKQKGNGFLPP